MRFKAQITVGLFLLAFLGEWVVLPQTMVYAEEDANDIKDEISEIEKKLKKAEEKKAALEREVNALSSSLSQAERTIKETEIKIQQAENTIERKKAEIELLEAKIHEEKVLLTELLQDLYYEGYATLPALLFSGDKFTDLMDHPDRLLSVKERITVLLNSLESRYQVTATEKGSLEEAKEDHEALLAKKASEKQVLAADRAETLEEVEDQAKVISRLQKELKDLQGDLAVLTGKNYNAKDIREAVEDASDETGVPEGVLYGFLKMETNLGANTGQCTYKKVRDDAMNRYYKKDKKKYKNSIALLEKRFAIFLEIVDELNYSKDKKVSCTPGSYVGQGGAMGVAQFMSDTWRGYEADIRSKTGHKNPDPWNLTDGVMAMALKLRKAGATSDSSSAIKKASINYLGNFNNNYYSGIVYWAKNYKKLFN